MIEQQGRILSLQGSQATVLLGASSGCPACDAGKGCGAGIFGRLVVRKPVSLELDNPLHLQPGLAVRVGISESFFLRLLLNLYLLPLLAGLAGAALGHFLAGVLTLADWRQDVIALLGALFLAGLTLPLNLTGKRWQKASGQISLLGYPALRDGQSCQAAMD